MYPGPAHGPPGGGARGAEAERRAGAADQAVLRRERVQAHQAAVQPHPRDRAAQRSHLLGPGPQGQEDREQNQTEQVNRGLQQNVSKSKTIEKEVTIFDFLFMGR